MRMYHIGFLFRKKSLAKSLRINNALNEVAQDWMRYSDSAWIAYAESADQLHIFIREAIEDKDQFLIIPVDMSAPRQGLLAPWIWKWLAVDRSQPNWRSLVDQIDYPPPPPPLPPPAQFSLEDLVKHLSPPKDES